MEDNPQQVPISSRRARRQRARRRDGAWNCLTVLILLVGLVMGAAFIYLYMFPETPYNPFPLPTQAVALVLPTQAPASPTVTATRNAPRRLSSATASPFPTLTSTDSPPTATFTVVPTATITFTPPPTFTPKPYYPFPYMAQSQPQAISASVFNPSRGCGWMGIGGRVTDMQNRSVTGITVQVVGSLAKLYVNKTSLTGLASAYGPSGYEFTLADLPVASKGQLSVRLLDQAGNQISETLQFDTFEDCQRNLIVIDFKQMR